MASSGRQDRGTPPQPCWQERSRVIAGGETGGRWLGGTDRQLRALLLSRFVDQKLTTFICRENYEDLLVLTELIEAGRITPVIDRSYPLSEAPKAIRYLEPGHARGKVVITSDGQQHRTTETAGKAMITAAASL